VQDAVVGVDVERADLERLYREQGRRLWRAVVLATGHPEVASDAVAEAFAQAIARGDELRDPAAWVWRASFRIAMGEMKQRRLTAPLEVDVVQDMPESFLDLWRALATLTPHQRTAVVMADYAGWSHREIAKALGSSASAVGVHVHRARRRLRAMLEERDD
jgi:RNA polymerase sigma-70 factor (ECF subfamily)